MSAALLDFAKYVRPEVAGCPDVQILDAILHAGIEFCEKSKVSRETIELETDVGVARYTLDVAADTKPDEIITVTRDTTPLEPANEKIFHDLRLVGNGGTPFYYYLDDTDIVLGLEPDAVETLSVLVKTSPVEDATSLPDELYNRYRKEIAAGAKAMLMMMRGQQWTDLQQAGVYAGVYQAAIGAANLRYAKGGSGGSTPLRTVAHIY